MFQLDDHPPRLDHLVGVARPQGDETRNGAQAGELLDRLVRRAVLAQADRIMGEDVDRRQLHQGGQPDRGRM